MTYKYPEKHDRQMIVQRDVDTLFNYFNDLNNGSTTAIVQDLYVSNAITSSGSWQNVDWSLFKTVATPSTMHSFSGDTITINETKNYTIYFGVNYTNPPCNIIVEVLNNGVSLLSQRVSLVSGDTGDYESWDKKTVKLSASDSITVRVKNAIGSGNTVKVYMFIVYFNGMGNAKSRFSEKHYFNQPDIERAFTCLNDINKGRTVVKPFPENIDDNDINEIYKGIRDLIDNGSTTAMKCNVECLDIGTVLSGSDHTPTWGNQTGSLVLTITGGVVYLTPTEPITMIVSVHDPASHSMTISSGSMVVTKYTLEGTPVTLPDIYELDISFNLEGTANDTFVVSVNTFDTTYHLPCFRLSNSKLTCNLKLLKYSTGGSSVVWQMFGKNGIHSFCSSYPFNISSWVSPAIIRTDIAGISNMVIDNASGEELMFYAQRNYVNAMNKNGGWTWWVYLDGDYPPPAGYSNFGTQQLFIFNSKLVFYRMWNNATNLIYEKIVLNQEDGFVDSQTRETINLNNLVGGQISAGQISANDLTCFKVSDTDYYLYVRFYADIATSAYGVNGVRIGNIIFNSSGYSIEYSVGTYPVCSQPIITDQFLKPSQYVKTSESIQRVETTGIKPNPRPPPTEYRYKLYYTLAMSYGQPSGAYILQKFIDIWGAGFTSASITGSTTIINDNDTLNYNLWGDHCREWTANLWGYGRYYVKGSSEIELEDYSQERVHPGVSAGVVRNFESFTGYLYANYPSSSMGATSDKIFIATAKLTHPTLFDGLKDVRIKIYDYSFNLLASYEVTSLVAYNGGNVFLCTIEKDGKSYCYWKIHFHNGTDYTLMIGRASVEDGLEILFNSGGWTVEPRYIKSAIIDPDGNLLMSIQDNTGNYLVAGMDWNGIVNCIKIIDVDELVAGEEGVWGIKKNTGYIYKL